MTTTKKDKTYKITEYVNMWNVKLLNSIIDVNFELSKKDFLTIDEFAKKCGFSKQFISQMENETRPISKNLLCNIKANFKWAEELLV